MTTDAPPTAGFPAPDYRLPDSTRVGRVRLHVSDIDRSLRFYEELLGFRVVDRSPTRAVIGPQDDDAELVELHAPSPHGLEHAPSKGRLGLYHFAILLPDRGALGRMLARLVERGVSPGMADHAVSEALYLSDPDGLGVEIYSDRPRGDWQRRGRELLMLTEPLDVDSVIRAGGAEPWRGMPAGTAIGHVHLHVGDLDRAGDFYHAALGLDKMVWSYRGALFLAAGGYHHHLGVNVWAGASATAPAENEARLLDWELVVPGADDIAKLAESLAGGGFGARLVEHGVLETLDPWGTALRVVAAAG